MTNKNNNIITFKTNYQYMKINVKRNTEMITKMLNPDTSKWYNFRCF